MTAKCSLCWFVKAEAARQASDCACLLCIQTGCNQYVIEQTDLSGRFSVF